MVSFVLSPFRFFGVLVQILAFLLPVAILDSFSFISLRFPLSGKKGSELKRRKKTELCTGVSVRRGEGERGVGMSKDERNKCKAMQGR